MIYSFGASLLLLFIILIVRYFALAGSFHLILSQNAHRLHSLRLSHTTIPKNWIKQDILWSIASSSVFALSGIVMLIAWERGWTKIYFRIAEKGWSYFIFSLGLAALIHETYFYLTHRVLHRPFWMKRVHRIHHRSIQPTAWTSFAFHPIEALIQALIIPVIVMFLPLHIAAVAILVTAMSFLGVINHLGYEIYGRRFSAGPLTSWMVSATHHQKHHERFNCNYGLYFTFWDRLLGTEATK